MAKKLSFFKNFFSLCQKTFFEVWLPDHPGVPQNNWLHWLAVFLSLPNRTPKNHFDIPKNQSAWNLFKKFFGWQEQRKLHPGKTIRNLLIGILILAPINLITVAFQLPISILKVFTEFLPRLITNAIERKIRTLKNEIGDKKWRKRKRKHGEIFALSLLASPFYLIYFLSRSMTTPIKGFKKSYDSGYHRGVNYAKWLSRFFKEQDNSTLMNFFKKHKSKIAAIFAIINSFLSVISTAVTWGLAIPLALQAAVTFAPNAIVILTNQAITFVSSHLSFIGQWLTQATITMPELIGLSSITGLLISTLGVPISNSIENFKKYWYKQEKNIYFFSRDEFEGSGSYSNLRNKLPGFLFSPRQTINTSANEVKHVFIKPKQTVAHNTLEHDMVEDSSEEYSSSYSFSL